MPVFSAHLGYLFTELPLAERFSAAAAAGFTVVEHPAPYEFGLQAFAAAVRRERLSVAQVASPAGDPASGEKGLACLAGRETAFQENVLLGIEAARVLGTEKLHVMPGCVPPGLQRSDLVGKYLDNMNWAAERCSDAGLTLLIEPISDETVPGFFVNDPVFAIGLLEQLDSRTVRLLFDAYHAAVKGIDPVAFVEKHLDLIAHIQVADFPGRHEPGTGRIDYDRFFDRLDRLGYGGSVGCEYKPAGRPAGGFGWMHRFTGGDRSG